MLIFLGFVLLIIIIVISKKRQPPVPSRIQLNNAPKSYVQPRKVNQVALDMATKHFGGEWLQFLAAKNDQSVISEQRIREMVAIGYSQMKTKALEHLLVSFIHFTTDNVPGPIGGTINNDNYTALHESIYRLIKQNQFNQKSILATLNVLSETAQAGIQRAELERKAKAAENKVRQLELRQQLADQRKVMAQNESDLRLEAAEHKRILKMASTTTPVRVPEAQPKLNHNLLQSQTLDLSTDIWQPSERVLDDSIIEVSQESTMITLPPLEPLQYASNYQTNYPEYDPDQYSLGKKYKKKLNLAPQEVKWLNKFWNYSNVFNAIEGCEVEIIKLYLLTIKLLKKRLKKENSSLDQEIEPLKTMTAEFQKSHPNYWQGYDEVYTGESAESEVYNYIYKKAESVIREQWNHKRKISAVFSSGNKEIKELFDRRLGNLVEEIVMRLIPTIGVPDETTEIALNEATTTRWKTQFQELTGSYQATKHPELVAALHKLGKLNSKNPSVERIYYEASKFMTPLDKVEALKFYLHYIWEDLNSVVVDRKELNKTIQKKLFAHEGQLSTFQEIIDELVSSRNLTAALKAVDGIYKTRRKNITLDTEAIRRVVEQHNGTVDKLNEYLQDEEEVYELQVNRPTEPSPVVETGHVLTSVVPLSKIQLECLRLFDNESHSADLADIESFAKSESVFKNQLIDGINESCYEVLDDVLIEETEDGYEINPDYYTQILAYDSKSKT